MAYALASRIAKQIAAGLGDKNDIYGGLGSNGAQITPEADNTYNLDMTTNYNFIKGKVYNLNADACITGHSDICKEEAARAIFTAIAVE